MRGGRRVFAPLAGLAGAAAQTPRAARAALALTALAAAGAALAGCGGSEATAGEPARSFDVKIANASFPAKQSVAKPARMELSVTNTGSHTIPSLAVTVDSFDYISHYPGLADKTRPLWAIEKGPGKPAKPPVPTQEVSMPGGGETAYVNTWSLGALAPNSTRTFTWRVVPVKPGSYTVHYSVAAGLAGKAKARLASGGPATGKFDVKIAGAPAITHVDAKTGKVVVGEYAAPAPGAVGP